MSRVASCPVWRSRTIARGITIPAQEPKACTTRKAIRVSMSGASAQPTLPIAKKLDLAKAAGLWRFLNDAHDALVKLHEAGIAHGDLELHNLIVCSSPLECILIDFEATVRKDDLDEKTFDKRLKDDFLPMLKEAVLLQCALGIQPGPLAELSRERAADVFKRPDRFLDEIGEQSKIA